MEVIVPAAGQSSRYSAGKPKYLLYDYKGRLALDNVIRPYYDRGYLITVVILHEHDIKFRARDHIMNAFPSGVRIVVLDDPTSGPAETVYRGLGMNDGPFLVKDCDNFFEHAPILWGTNVVYAASLDDLETVSRPASKSYLVHNDENIITSIVEKRVVSDVFSCGAYLFSSKNEYKKAYEEFTKIASGEEVFVSHIINHMIHKNTVFSVEKVYNLVDLGTQKEWDKWNNRPTIFCDIDGTLVWSKDRLSYDTPPEVHVETYRFILNKIEEGCQIVFTTARPESARTVTRNMLDELGFDGCQLIMGLHNSKRVLINDYNTTTNKYPTAIAYNVFRDSDELDMVWTD